MRVRSERELVDAVRSGAPELEILVDTPLGKLVIKVKSMGPLAWAALIGVLGVSVVGILMLAPTLGPPGLIGAAAPGAAIGVGLLGLSGWASAARVLKEARNDQVLRAIRDEYRIELRGEVVVLLRR